MASNYRIHNDTVNQVVAIMDSNRESHVIPADGTAIFTQASVGDRPTFRIFWDLNKDGQPDSEAAQAAKKASHWSALVATGDYTFNGKELD